MEKKKITIRLYGRDYSLVSDQPDERVQDIAGYVDRKMRELAIASRAGESIIPVLTCMTIAEDLFKAREENVRLTRQIAELTGPKAEE